MTHGATGAPLTGSASRRPPSRWSCRPIWCASARPASSTCARSDAQTSIAQRQRDQADGADDDAPPGEQRETVALHVAEESLHHDPGGDERDREPDRDEDAVVQVHLSAALVEIVDEGPEHCRHCKPEREFGSRATVGA